MNAVGIEINCSYTHSSIARLVWIGPDFNPVNMIRWLICIQCRCEYSHRLQTRERNVGNTIMIVSCRINFQIIECLNASQFLSDTSCMTRMKPFRHRSELFAFVGPMLCKSVCCYIFLDSQSRFLTQISRYSSVQRTGILSVNYVQRAISIYLSINYLLRTRDTVNCRE